MIMTGKLIGTLGERYHQRVMCTDLYILDRLTMIREHVDFVYRREMIE